jgi:hypothetical protein
MVSLFYAHVCRTTFKTLICFIHFISGEIQSKFSEGSTLLEVSPNRGTESVDLAKKLYMVQEQFCRAKKIGHVLLSVLGFAVCKGGEALVDWSVLYFMLQSEGTNACVKVGINSCEHVVAPMAGKAIAKKYLRVIGTAAVGIGILLDFVEIIQSLKALDSKKLSDIVDTLEKAANEAEDVMKNIEKILATPPFSVQNPFSIGIRPPPLYDYITNWFGRFKALFFILH